MSAADLRTQAAAIRELIADLRAAAAATTDDEQFGKFSEAASHVLAALDSITDAQAALR